MPIGYGITYGDLLNGMIDDWSNHLTWSDQSDFTNVHAPITSGVTLVVKNGKIVKPKTMPEIKSVVFNEEKGYTTILWADGTSTVVKCGEGEKFERYEGFVMAIAKKLFGSTSAAKKEMNDKDVYLQKELKILREEQAAMEQRKLEEEAHKRKVQREAARIMRDKKFMAEVREELKNTYGEQF